MARWATGSLGEGVAAMTKLRQLYLGLLFYFQDIKNSLFTPVLSYQNIPALHVSWGGQNKSLLVHLSLLSVCLYQKKDRTASTHVHLQQHAYYTKSLKMDNYC